MKEDLTRMYEILQSSIKHEETRGEVRNQVWLAANSFGITGAHFFKETFSSMTIKVLVIYTMIFIIGMSVCVAWFISLQCTQEKLIVKKKYLHRVESQLDFDFLEKRKNHVFLERKEIVLQRTEMAIPLVFFISYALIAGLSISDYFHS